MCAVGHYVQSLCIFIVCKIYIHVKCYWLSAVWFAGGGDEQRCSFIALQQRESLEDATLASDRVVAFVK